MKKVTTKFSPRKEDLATIGMHAYEDSHGMTCLICATNEIRTVCLALSTVLLAYGRYVIVDDKTLELEDFTFHVFITNLPASEVKKAGVEIN